MKFKELSQEQKTDIMNSSHKEAVSKFNVDQSTITRWKQKIKKEGLEVGNQVEEVITVISPEVQKITRLEKENKALKKAVNEAKTHVIDTADIKSLIYKINNTGYLKEDSNIPKWINKDKNGTDEIVPVFCLSDIHVGSVIDAANVNFANEYNLEIAKERIFQLVDDFIDMYTNKLSNYKYNGCVCIFGGDMIENAMHGTEEVNDLTVVNQVIETTSILIEVITRLEKAFTKVFIPSVSGNHGRLIADKYTKTNNRLEHSLEKIVYHYVSLHFKDNKYINLVTSESDIIHFSINSLKFRLEHGDGIRFTGQAISGPLNSWERGRLKRASVDSAMGNNFDVLIFGHFHQHLISTKIVAMNSTKGYDPYVMGMSLPYALPGATSFAINSRGEMIFSTNLVCREKTKKEKPQKNIELF